MKVFREPPSRDDPTIISVGASLDWTTHRSRSARTDRGQESQVQ